MGADALYGPLGAFEVLAPSLGVQITGAPRRAACAAPRAIRMGAEPSGVEVTLDFRHGSGRYRVTLAGDEARVDQYYRDRWGNASLRVIEGDHQRKSRALVLKQARYLLERTALTIPIPTGDTE